ncbi:MAG: GPW/gp25 family protein [Gammaproteobacteria bacterium]|nr:GPW/gp25 family protein [Gammaproteobacteria bacterium]
MTSPLENRLPRTRYMAFPFRLERNGPATSTRMEHIREQVEQVLFTSPGERVFRPEFGFGARQHVFEPNAAPLWELARGRLFGSLAEALAGEVDPKTLRVEVGPGPGQPEVLLVQISYTIAALQKEERHSFTL